MPDVSIQREATTRSEQVGVADAVRAAYESRQPISPVGGKTSLDFGGTPPGDANQLELTQLNNIVDYTPRDMTIVVEAGVRMSELAATLVGS